MTDQSYVLVTPVRDEERTIEITIKSVLEQTVIPREWIIVSDQSTDQTDKIVSRYAMEFSWLRLIQMKDRPPRNFSSVVYVTESGIQSLRTKDYGFLGLLDGDVRLPRNYYAQILARFGADARLGLAGGLVVDTVNGKRVRNRQHLQDVAGAVQFFRRNCFEALDGLTALPEGGWDAITCVQARMHGFKTATFSDLIVEHLKPRNAASGGALSRHWHLGLRDHGLAYHPLFEVAKCCARSLEFPPLMGSFVRLAGYGYSWIGGRTFSLPPDVAANIRREQLARLMPFRLKPRNTNSEN